MNGILLPNVNIFFQDQLSLYIKGHFDMAFWYGQVENLKQNECVYFKEEGQQQWQQFAEWLEENPHACKNENEHSI